MNFKSCPEGGNFFKLDYLSSNDTNGEEERRLFDLISVHYANGPVFKRSVTGEVNEQLIFKCVLLTVY